MIFNPPWKQHLCFFVILCEINHDGDTFASQAWMVSLYGYPYCVAKVALWLSFNVILYKKLDMHWHSGMLHLFSIDHALFFIREYHPAGQCLYLVMILCYLPVVSLLPL